jgi:hypothetical protein
MRAGELLERLPAVRPHLIVRLIHPPGRRCSSVFVPKTCRMTIEAETDLSAYVLHLLDDHLTAMHEIRERMRLGGTISPGARRAAALDSIVAARRYADRLTGALGEAHPDR